MTPEALRLCIILNILLFGWKNWQWKCLRNIESLGWRILESYGNLYQYLSDEDIRRKNPECKKFQDEELKKLLTCPRSDKIEAA